MDGDVQQYGGGQKGQAIPKACSVQGCEIYQPLDPEKQQLRLAVLQPSLDPLYIEFSLVTVDLSNITHNYTALSYEWGSPSPKKGIVLQGQPFLIGENLWNALVHMRSTIGVEMIWIDAICISQGDVSERSHQVSFMGEIYRRAKVVRVWLGLEGGGSREALSLLRSIWEMAPLCNPYNDETEQEMFDESNPAWDGLAQLLCRNYWRRVWILQEVILSTHLDIHCGDDFVEWPVLLYGLEQLGNFSRTLHIDLPSHYGSTISKVLNSPAVKIFNFRKTRGNLFYTRERDRRNRLPLLSMLEACIAFRSSDPRDKVYAMLGLATDITPNAIIVDYSRSIFKVKMDVIWYYHQLPRSPNMDLVIEVVDKLLGEHTDCEE